MDNADTDISQYVTHPIQSDFFHIYVDGFITKQFSMKDHEKGFLVYQPEKVTLNILQDESRSNQNGIVLNWNYDILQKLREKTED